MSYPDNLSSRAFNRYWQEDPTPRTRAQKIADRYAQFTDAQLASEWDRLERSMLSREVVLECTDAITNERTRRAMAMEITTAGAGALAQAAE